MNTDTGESASTREAIMRATLVELAERGIGNLTIKSVAIASGNVPSVVIYHYKTKEGLLLACANHFASAQGRLTDELAELLAVDEDPTQTVKKLVALCLERGQEARVIVQLQMYLQIIRMGQTEQIWKESLRSFEVLTPLLVARFGIESDRARAVVHQLSVMVVRLTIMEDAELAEVYGCAEGDARPRAFSYIEDTLLRVLT